MNEADQRGRIGREGATALPRVAGIYRSLAFEALSLKLSNLKILMERKIHFGSITVSAHHIRTAVHIHPSHFARLSIYTCVKRQWGAILLELITTKRLGDKFWPTLQGISTKPCLLSNAQRRIPTLVPNLHSRSCLVPQYADALGFCALVRWASKHNDADGLFGPHDLSSSGNSTRQTRGKEPFDDGLL